MRLKIKHLVFSIDHSFFEYIHALIFLQDLSDFVLLLGIPFFVNFNFCDFPEFLYSCFQFTFLLTTFVMQLKFILNSLMSISGRIHLDDTNKNSRRSLRQTLRYLFHVELLVLTDFDLTRFHQLFVRPKDSVDNQLYHSHAFFESHIANLLSDDHNFVFKVDFAKYFVLVCLYYSLLFYHFTIVKFLIVMDTLLVHKS